MFAGIVAFSQSSTPKKVNLSKRDADHFVFQIASNFWNGAPDSVTTFAKKINRSANVYVMYDMPFKTNPKFSVALGIGIGTSAMYFKKMETKIGSTNKTLPFIRTDTGFNYKKYKLATSYIEIPLEFRFMSKPEDPNKSFKIALGVKGGLLLNAHTKAKNLQTATGAKVNGNTIKETSKSYFNSSKIAITGRIGYGPISLFGAYNVTNMFKDAVAADTKLVQIGISFSGL